MPIFLTTVHYPLSTVIGVFDSGLGGLTVLKALRAQAPGARLVYMGDNAHIPYGARPMAEVRQFSESITRFLLGRGATAIVVACNTASAAALNSLRLAPEFAGVPFVGMEPAVKPAAARTRSGVVGVLATPATFQGELYASVVERFASGVRVIEQVCPGLVQQVEAGRLDTPDTEAMLRAWVEPMLAQGVDVLVLGCTHYPFVIPLLEKICGPEVAVVDPAPAVARQAGIVVSGQWTVGSGREGERRSTKGHEGDAKVVGGGREVESGQWTVDRGRLADSAGLGEIVYYTSGELREFEAAVGRLGAPQGKVYKVQWRDGRVVGTW